MKITWTSAHATLWRVRLFGELEAAFGNEQSINRFSTQKTASLFAFLAINLRTPQQREVLADMFWPDAADTAGRNNLSVALSSLRSQFDTFGHPYPSILIADPVSVRLNPTVLVTDVDTFEEAVKELGKAPEAEFVGDLSLEGIAALYRGQLLAGHYGDWVLARRDQLADSYLGVLRRLIRQCHRQRDMVRAIDWAHKAIAVDPLRETSHRTLMRLYKEAGRTGAALQHFRELERLLKRTLDVGPEPKTRELVAQLLSDADEQSATAPSFGVSTKKPEPAVQADSPAPLQTAPTVVPSPDRPKSNIPLPLTRFFGRTSEIELIHELIGDVTSHLITLTGPGGIGKTRTAVEAARSVTSQFGAVWFVRFEEVRDPEIVPETVRDCVGLPRSTDVTSLEQIGRACQETQSLFVLDNMEHLVERGLAYVLERVIDAAPEAVFVATSRQTIGVYGEREVVLGPLQTPGASAALAQIQADDSVRLFVDRARMRQPDFQVTERNCRDIAQLVGELDGIPLAIELAASWVRMLTVKQMIADNSRRLDLFATNRRDLPPRHRSLRAAIEGSVSLLPESQRRLFSSLSIFHGGWTIESAAAICGEGSDDPRQDDDSDPWERQLLLLRHLQERSLIVGYDSGTEIRYRMLETIRDYAHGLLDESLTHELADRHAHYFARYSEETAPSKFTGGVEREWLDRMEADHDNLRAAQEWLLTGDIVAASRFADTLWRFWHVRGYFAEGIWRVKKLVASPRESELDCRARVSIRNACGNLARMMGDYETAESLFTSAVGIAREGAVLAPLASAMNNLGIVYMFSSRYELARETYIECLAIKRKIGKEHEIASTLSNLGQVTLYLGDLDAAEALFSESLSLARNHDQKWGMSVLLCNLADLNLRRNDHGRATSLLFEALEISCGLGDKVLSADAMVHFASMFRTRGSPQASVQAVAHASLLYDQSGTSNQPSTKTVHELVEELRGDVPAVQFEEAWMQGQSMTTDEATKYLRDEVQRLHI